jgi:hypothetical protein
MDVFAKNIPRDLNAADHIDWSMPSKKVEGSLVFNRNGERLGIDHLMFDKNSGRYYAVLRLSTLLGISERYYAAPWTSLAYYTRLGGYIADIDLGRLQKAPSYTKSTPPELVNFRGVEDYWGSARR